MRLLIDGIIFRISSSGIARVWQSLIPLLVAKEDIEVFVLDRGGMPVFDGVQVIPFPTTSMTGASVFNYCADDSILIQRVCDHYGIDVFSSTYFTTPLSTPAVLMVYDMIPELFGFNMNQSVMMEKEMGISYAQRYLCISQNTKHDLCSLYPEIPGEEVSVAYCGVDDRVFRIRSQGEVAKFREAHGLERPYCMFVGSRVQHNGYKNSRLFFDAVSMMDDVDFDVLCVGGEPSIDASLLSRLPDGMRCRRVVLTDDELATAYNGADALVYPSLYEGFGMPVIEAMACGCPVITTRHGSLAEAAGDAASLVSGTSVPEMIDALQRIRLPGYRDELKLAGLAQARKFRWQDMADQFAADVAHVHAAAMEGRFDAFFAAWRELRTVQASVDFHWIPPIS